MGTSFFPDEGMDLRESREGDAHWEREMHALTKSAVHAALKAGVRLFDLSHLYQNTKAVAEALHEAMDAGTVARSELCICMKLMARDDGGNLLGLAESLLRSLNLKAFDLALLYLPAPSAQQAVQIWARMEALVRAGLARSLGLSNHYEPEQIRPLLDASIPPVINQIEMHPMQRNPTIHEFCRRQRIVLMAHSPLGAPNKVAYLSVAVGDPRIGEELTLLRHPTVTRLARRHGVTSAQLLLLWSTHRGHIPIPKSYSLDHVRDNAAVLAMARRVKLTERELCELDDLHRADDFNACKFFHAANSIRAQRTAEGRAPKPAPKPAPEPAPPVLPVPAVSPRVAALQREFRMPGKAPPASLSAQWSDRLLRRWFEAGGVVTMAAAEEEEDDATYRSLLDQVGVGLPFRDLSPMRYGGDGGLLGAAARGETAVFNQLADAIARDGWVLADLGPPAGHGVWARVRDEGMRLLPRMGPGMLESADGKVTLGKSPSGAARGDVYLTASEALAKGGGANAYPALATLDQALAVVGHALAPAIERHERLRHRIRLRTDPFFKVFPGKKDDSKGYGAHFDGGQVAQATKLTAVLYLNEGWREEDGGQLRILDERRGCWRSVTPHAGRIILFLVKDCLHKVEPSRAMRFALTNWWMEPNYRPGQVADTTVTVRSAFESGPRRYEVLQEDVKHEVVRALASMS